jgi:C4-type Zn-finger protein
MPYKSEKIKIANTKYDKRIKLDDDDRFFIMQKYKRGQSIRSLAREFKVDRNVIKLIIDPEFAKSFKEANKKRQAKYRDENRYKDKRNNYMQVHRSYKQKLYLDKKIKLEKEKGK